MSLKIYHNPRCSKSRQTLSLLQENGHDPEVVLYLKDVPSADEITDLLKKLDMSSARDLMRTNEVAYRENGLANITDEAALITAMIENPKLIERPIVILNQRAKIGRPPEDVLTLFT